MFLTTLSEGGNGRLSFPLLSPPKSGNENRELTEEPAIDAWHSVAQVLTA